MVKKTNGSAMWLLLTANLVLGLYNLGTTRIEMSSFETLTAHRINIVDQDDGLRMVIASPDEMPGAIIDGTEIPRENRGSGLLFYNAEGDEVGGLTFDGERTPDGVKARSSLMFDQFKQDQTIGLMYNDEGGRRVAALNVWDRPNVSLVDVYNRVQAITEIKDERERRDARRALLREVEIRRVFLGRRVDTSAGIELSDQAGRPRIRMFVDGSGRPSLEFLDESGKVTRRLPD